MFCCDCGLWLVGCMDSAWGPHSDLACPIRLWVRFPSVKSSAPTSAQRQVGLCVTPSDWLTLHVGVPAAGVKDQLMAGKGTRGGMVMLRPPAPGKG